MLNHVSILGRLTAAPELRTTSSNVSVVRFTLAVDRDFKDKQTGERHADFIDVIAWRSTADFVAKYFAKGQLVAVSGRIQTNTYEDNKGNKRKAVEVLAENVYFAEPKRSNEAPQAPAYEGSSDDFKPLPVADDDLPF